MSIVCPLHTLHSLDLTRVVCMGYAQLCNIKYLNIDTTNVKGKCGYCINIARLLEYRVCPLLYYNELDSSCQHQVHQSRSVL